MTIIWVPYLNIKVSLDRHPGNAYQMNNHLVGISWMPRRSAHGQYLRRASSALISIVSPDPSDVILGYELLASIGDDGERNILNVAHWMDSSDIGR